MTDTEAKVRNVSGQLNGALAGWEGEGGALPSRRASQDSRDAHAFLTEDEEHILQCLGAAVIVQWNDLPTHIQRPLFDHAASMGEPRHATQLKEQIARFLHNHKDDSQNSA
jgi:hypothetical protein